MSLNYINELLARINKGDKRTRLLGLSGSALSLLLSGLFEKIKRPSLLILPDRKAAERLYREISFFSSLSNGDSPGNPHLLEFPPYDMTPFTGLSPHREVIARRLQSLYSLMTEENPVVVTSLEAVSLKTLPMEALTESIEYLETGEEIDRDRLLARIEMCGYQRSSLVEARGDYSVRGGVIDLFSPLYPLPLRLEFWGDRLESIREFDPLSQRSSTPREKMVIVPCSEILFGKKNLERARSMGRLPGGSEHWAGFPGQEAWLNHFYDGLDTVMDYLPANAVVGIFEPNRLEGISKRLEDKFLKDLEKSRKEAGIKGSPFPETDGMFFGFKDFWESLRNNQTVEFHELDLGIEKEQDSTIHVKGHFSLYEDMEVKVAGKGRVSLAPLAGEIARWTESGGRVVLVSRTIQQAKRIKEILENYGVSGEEAFEKWKMVPQKRGLYICLGRLSRGFLWHEAGLYVISEDEIFGPKGKGRVAARKSSRKPVSWSSFSQLKKGDLVVHEDHGIGRFFGLLKMEIDKRANDYVLIEYANNDRLYIPADRLSILQKYAGADERNPRLDQLGGRSWNVAKQKARKSVKKIARQLVEIYALRKYRKGHSFSPPDNYFREFEATFEHEETSDQIKAIDDVLEDMSSEQPMDRLICGDVGFGKTEIALRAAFKSISDGKQVALLVPTTVLAEQHYETFRKRMASFSVEVGILSRFRPRAEQTRIAAAVRSGKIDILVGTHRILQKDIAFRDLGLLIIDEEQRFGVKQKEALKKFRSLVDVLAITATPVPRTLQMSMMGVRDLSIIQTPPEDRQSIETYLSPYDNSLVARAIRAEIERGGQLFFVHNRVKDIEKVADGLKGIVPEARFAVAHGQMKEKALENTMIRFINKEIDVLVCTTIIESGLDIPSANTIIINEVDRLGLAQIYQLRGRVGRSSEKAYAYLMLSNGSSLTRDAEKRLRALMDFSHLGAGLHLAMHDLEIRGGGNILGFAQSGHISAVGYELYLKLIERAVAELKGEEWHEDVNPEINVNIPAFLPENYVVDADVRLNIYRRLSGLKEKDDLESLADEIRDRFGPLPRETENLMDIMSIRLPLKQLGIKRMDVGDSSIVLTFSENSTTDTQRLAGVMTKRPHIYRLLSQNRLKVSTGRLTLPEDFTKIRDALSLLNIN